MRTFWVAVSWVKGGNGGRDSVWAVIQQTSMEIGGR
jgi:hypothetical protein